MYGPTLVKINAKLYIDSPRPPLSRLDVRSATIEYLGDLPELGQALQLKSGGGDLSTVTINHLTEVWDSFNQILNGKSTFIYKI